MIYTKKLLIIVLLMVGISATQAQKLSVNQAKNAANQEKPDYNLAEKLIKEALLNNETKNDVTTWFTAGYIYNKKHEEERNKKLLKQNCNQELMYESFYSAYNYWTKCIVLDKQPDAKGVVKPKYTSEILTKIKKNIGALIDGGQYYYGLKNFELGFQYFDAYNKAVTSNDLQSLNLGSDPNVQKVPYYASLCAINLDNKIAIQALEFAKKTDFERYRVYSFLSKAYKKDGQEEKNINLLKDGISLYPDSIDFINEFTDNRILQKDFNNAIKFIQDAIAKKPTCGLYIALGRLYQESGKPEDLIKSTFQDAIKINPKADQAYYYLGLIIFNKAVEMNDKTNAIKDVKLYNAEIKKTLSTYGEALPYFKRASEIRIKVEYLIPLRTIYDRLRMVEDRNAIDNMIKKL